MTTEETPETGLSETPYYDRLVEELGFDPQVLPESVANPEPKFNEESE